MFIKKTITLSLLLACLLIPSTTRAEELTLVFTGQTNAMLYPCACPNDPEGGVARRATAIRRVRETAGNVVVVEAGDSFASGSNDQYAQNFEKDMQRTRVYLKSLRTMGYDAVLLSGQEFVFGQDFLKSEATTPFVSTNAPGIGAPAIVKRVGGLKVAILGMTDQGAADRGAADWKSPNLALAEKVASLKKEGADVIILLSSLRPQEDQEVLRGIKGVDVVVNGSPSLGAAKDSVIDGVIHLTTWWQSRRLGIVTLNVSGSGAKINRQEAVPLTAVVADDKEIASFLPVCFRDQDCRAGGGAMNPVCQDAGTVQAQCLYKERPKVGLTVIQPRRCHTCQMGEVLKIVREVFGPLEETFIFEDDPRAQEIISRYDIRMAPVYILDKNADKAAGFSSFAIFCEKVGDEYMIKPSVAGVSFVLGKKRIPRRLDVVLDASVMPTGLAALLEEFHRRHPEIDMVVHLMAKKGADGVGTTAGEAAEAEAQELRRAACVGEVSDDAMLSYLVCRQAQKEADPAACLTALKGDRRRVEACVAGENALKALEKRARFAADFPIAAAPAFVVENVEIFGVVNVPAYAEFEKTVMGVAGLYEAGAPPPKDKTK